MKTLIFVLTLIAVLSIFTSMAIAKKTLEITKTADKTSVGPGGIITYTITVTNTGDSAIGSFTVEDHLPEGVIYLNATPNETYKEMADGKVKRVYWEFSGLNADESTIITVRVQNNKTVGTLVNKASVKIGPNEVGSVTHNTNIHSTAIPEFYSIALPIVLSIASFGLITLKRKF